jgi:RHS repeat-associated protein
MKNPSIFAGTTITIGFLLLSSLSGQCFYNAQNDRAGNLGVVHTGQGGPPAACENGPFGELLSSTGPMAKANPLRFSTKYEDDETDLVYYGYRYYNASTGRWLTRDPAGERGGKALYAFVRNRPSSLIDRLGLKPCCDQACDTKGAKEVTGAAEVILPGDQKIGDPNIVDEMAKKIKKGLESCLWDPEHWPQAPSDEYLLDKAKDVAKGEEIKNFGVNLYTVLGYRSCREGSCDGIRGCWESAARYTGISSPQNQESAPLTAMRTIR